MLAHVSSSQDLGLARRRLSRRDALRIGLGLAALPLAAACGQQAAPAPTAAPAAPAAQPTQATKPAAPPAQQPAGAASPAATQQAPAQASGAAPSSATFRIAVGVEPDTLDPAGQTTTTIQNMVDYMVEPLVFLTPDGKPAPALAEKWEMAPDGKSYTFSLRKGVKFHDGAVFDAKAVKTSFDRFLSPNLKVPLRSPLDVVASVDVVDDSTVKFSLKNPFPPFIAAMTGTQTGILSPNQVQKFPDSYTDEPIGTGPYTFKARSKGESLTVARNESYWGNKPYYGTVQFRIVPEAATRESLLLANQAEMIILPPVSDIPKLQQNNQVKVLLAPSDRTIFIAIDVDRPGPTQNKLVRQALNYAVDKDGIIKAVLFGAADRMDAPMASSLFGYTKIGGYDYDPNKAKSLLSQAGVGSISLKMVYPTGRYVQDAQAAQAIAGNLRDVGIDVQGSTSDWPTYLATINVPPGKGTTDMHLLGWAPGYLDAAQQMVQFEKASWPPNGLATSHYTNPQVEELLAKAAEDPNEQNRAKDYADASKIIWDDAPWIFLWVQRFPIVYSAKVKGVTSLPTEKFQAVYAEPA